MYRSAAYEPAMSASVRARRLPPMPQRLDRPGALDRLGEAVGDLRVGRVLPQVAGRRPAQVPAGAETTASARRSGSGSASSGPTSTSAPTVSTPVTIAISVSGTANRTLSDSASTSREVRVSRSPVPARSTVDSGMASTRSTNSSRSSASTCSPSRAEARYGEPHQHRLRRPRTRRWPSAIRSTVHRAVPCWIASTRSPSSRGAARPATAASACRPTRERRARRGWRRISVQAYRRTCARVRDRQDLRSRHRPPPG